MEQEKQKSSFRAKFSAQQIKRKLKITYPIHKTHCKQHMAQGHKQLMGPYFEFLDYNCYKSEPLFSAVLRQEMHKKTQHTSKLSLTD